MSALCLSVVMATFLSAEAGALSPPDEPPAEPLRAQPWPALPSLTAEDSLRYDAAWLPRRVLADLISMPLELRHFNRQDAAFFALYTYAIVAMMVPDGTSLDARMQLQLNADLGQPRAKVWTKSGDAIIWGVVGSTLAAQWLYGLVADQPVRMQMVSLMFEAVAVAQIYHLILKLGTGRDGPDNGDGRGRFFGPGLREFRQFPSGTPSGHAISAYALLGVAVGFVEQPWLRVAMHMAALAFSVSLVVDNYHFVSDVLVGAAIGFGVGRWVGSHRSTRGVTRWYDDISVLPFVDPWGQGGGVGIAFPSPF